MTACATKPPLSFPTVLAEDCKETPTPLVTNADLVLKVRDLRKDLKVCNADKAGIREWVKANGLAPGAASPTP